MRGRVLPECSQLHFDGSTVVGAGLSSHSARAGYKLNGARTGTGCRRELAGAGGNAFGAEVNALRTYHSH